jgi:hypothetical protein
MDRGYTMLGFVVIVILYAVIGLMAAAGAKGQGLRTSRSLHQLPQSYLLLCADNVLAA